MNEKSIAWLFPGQGAQAVGMGRDLAEADPAMRAWFDRAGEVLQYDLASLCFNGPLEALTRSDRAQPAIFVVSVACAERLRQACPEAEFVAAAGLSSGEWTALYQAGALGFEDTVRVLQARGVYMQEACQMQPGAMLSVIGLDEDGVQALATRCGVEVANYNSPGQTVLSGRVEGIEAAEALAKEAGARMAVRLNVAGAFHSSLMQPAADRLATFLAEIPIRAPSIPVASNVTGQAHGTPEEIRAAMVRQVVSSVRWVDDMNWVRRLGVTRLVECGPGKVLAGLMKRIDKQAVVHTIQDAPGVEAASQALRG